MPKSTFAVLLAAALTAVSLSSAQTINWSSDPLSQAKQVLPKRLTCASPIAKILSAKSYAVTFQPENAKAESSDYAFKNCSARGFAVILNFTSPQSNKLLEIWMSASQPNADIFFDKDWVANAYVLPASLAQGSTTVSMLRAEGISPDDDIDHYVQAAMTLKAK